MTSGDRSSLRREMQMENKLLKEYKAASHRKWLKRQEEYHKIIERDCYGYKRAKVQDVEGTG